MISRAVLLSTFFLSALFIFGCGHSSTLLEDSFDELPSANAALNKPVFDWRKARTEASANTNATNGSQAFQLFPTGKTFQESEPDNPLDAFIQEYVSFNPGPGSRYGRESINEWLLGPPYGGGKFIQSGDVVSLGNGGEIILAFPRYFPIDGTGADFIIFENAFLPTGSDTFYMEPAIVSVSQDGIHFFDFPCSPTYPYEGCAGTRPVYANPDHNSISPRDPLTAGGDAFDLRQLGLNYIRTIKIRDANLNLAGNTGVQAGQAGFDLDAIAIVHGAKP